MKLVVQSGQDFGSEFPLTAGSMVIGKLPGNDIVINDALVSRRHAQIRRQGNQFMIEDLGSRNGTYVNGERITTPQVLQSGTELRLGRTTLLLQDDARLPAVRGGAPVAMLYPTRQRAAKDPGMAALLEVLFGLFGFLGVGWIYAGNVGRGLLTMVGFWLFLLLFFVLGAVTLGLALCLFIPLYLTIIAFSTMGVHRYVEQMAEAYTD